MQSQELQPLSGHRRLPGNEAGKIATPARQARDEARAECLLNNLVGRGQQRFRDGEAERLGGLEVDDQFELGRRLNGEIGGFCAT